MLSSIKFVRGAVAKKDYVAELTHFLIKDGRITGFNGVMALSSPIDIDLNARPKATTFANAITRCTDTISLHMTKAGRLSIKSGKFRALVDCIEDDHSIIPKSSDGHTIDVGERFMDAIRAVERFQGIDASRPWAMGVLFHNHSVMATNNVVFVEYWHGHQMPFDMQIPAVAVKELLRINETPTRVTTDEHSLTFHYEGGRWLRTALIADGWPDNAIDLLNREFNYAPVPTGLFDGLETLKPFLDKDESIYFREGQISTSATDELGAHYEVPEMSDVQCYAFKVLTMLSDATAIDFTPYPAPCGFTANGMRGMFLGLRI